MQAPAILFQTPLFCGFSQEELTSILGCLRARKVTYQKDECLMLQGSKPQHIGILLEGTATIRQEDSNGRTAIISELLPGDSFGEAFVYAQVSALPISVWAHSPVQVLYLDYRKMISTCASACAFHSKLIANMLAVMAQKLILMNTKMQIMQKTSIREKLLALFEFYAGQEGRRTFTLPLNRNGLAEYLSVNRSAMSRELSRMQQEGLLSAKGNTITLL